MLCRIYVTYARVENGTKVVYRPEGKNGVVVDLSEGEIKRFRRVERIDRAGASTRPEPRLPPATGLSVATPAPTSTPVPVRDTLEAAAQPMPIVDTVEPTSHKRKKETSILPQGE